MCPNDLGNDMSDARGGSGRNADRSAPDGAPSPTPPADQGGAGGGHAASATSPGQGPEPPSWRAMVTGLLEEEGGIAAVPPA
jgi:hypothetical protein